MFRPRRRPLLRGAMLGGAGYMAGKRAQQGTMREQGQEERLEALEGQQQQQQQPAAAAPAGQDVVGRLTELKALLDAGALTPDEFEAAKRKVLGT